MTAEEYQILTNKMKIKKMKKVIEAEDAQIVPELNPAPKAKFYTLSITLVEGEMKIVESYDGFSKYEIAGLVGMKSSDWMNNIGREFAPVAQ